MVFPHTCPITWLLTDSISFFLLFITCFNWFNKAWTLSIIWLWAFLFHNIWHSCLVLCLEAIAALDDFSPVNKWTNYPNRTLFYRIFHCWRALRLAPLYFSVSTLIALVISFILASLRTIYILMPPKHIVAVQTPLLYILSSYYTSLQCLVNI